MAVYHIPLKAVNNQTYADLYLPEKENVVSNTHDTDILDITKEGWYIFFTLNYNLVDIN